MYVVHEISIISQITQKIFRKEKQKAIMSNSSYYENGEFSPTSSNHRQIFFCCLGNFFL